MRSVWSSTHAREILWKDISGCFPNVDSRPRKQCQLDDILNSRIRRAPGKARRNKPSYGEYMVKRKGYTKPSWEPAQDVLPAWERNAIGFHRQYPYRPVPTEFTFRHPSMRPLADTSAPSRGSVPYRPSSTTFSPRRSNEQEARHSQIPAPSKSSDPLLEHSGDSSDLEIDEAFARMTMSQRTSKLQTEGALPSCFPYKRTPSA